MLKAVVNRLPLLGGKGTRRARSLKLYKNPHSGEIVETKGGNHKLLKEWKGQYGSDEELL